MPEEQIPDDILKAYILLISESVTPEEKQAKELILKLWQISDENGFNRVKEAINSFPGLKS